MNRRIIVEGSNVFSKSSFNQKFTFNLFSIPMSYLLTKLFLSANPLFLLIPTFTIQKLATKLFCFHLQAASNEIHFAVHTFQNLSDTQNLEKRIISF